MAENTKPQQFTKDAKWQDWVPTFLEFLRNIAARNGGNERRLLVVLAFGLVSAILLQYSVQPHELPDYMHQTNFILYWWRLHNRICKDLSDTIKIRTNFLLQLRTNIDARLAEVTNAI